MVYFNKKLFLLLALILVVVFINATGAFDAMNEQLIDRHIRDQGMFGIVWYLAFCSLFTASGLPRQFAALLGGYAFGFVFGVLLATLASTIGCLLTFYIANIIARPTIEKMYEDKVKALNNFLKNRTFTMTIIIRLLPVGSNLITNLAAGVTQINVKPFLLGSFIGYLPQMIIFALVGSGIEVMSYWKIVVSIALLLVSSALGAYLYKEYKLEKSMASL